MIIVKILKIMGWMSFLLLMGLVFFLASGISSTTIPQGWTAPVMIVAAIIPFALLLGASAVNWFLNQRILMKGADAEAKILMIKSTGEKTNNNPVIDFTLEVRPANHPEFMANARQLVRMENVANLQPDKFVYVRYLPGTEKAVITGLCQNPTENLWVMPSNLSPVYPSNPNQIPRPTAFGILIKALIPVVFVVGILGFIAYIFLFAPKFTEEYSCAMAQLRKNAEAERLLGSPIEAGFIATGNFSMGSRGRNTHFTTSVSGPKGEGTLKARAYRHDGLGSNLEMILEINGKHIELYDAVYPCQ
jgi:hypothetical protein